MDLLVISNHPPEIWNEAQKKLWDNIEYIPFPNVSPDSTIYDVSIIGEELIKQIKATKITVLNIQGEYSLFSYLFAKLFCQEHYTFAFPSTERIVEQKKDNKKLVTFKFKQWRVLTSA